MPRPSVTNNPNPPRLQAGVNLIELLIVLVIAGLLLGVALPAGQGMLERGQLRAATNETYAALLFARNEATRLRSDIGLCFVDSISSTGCSNNPPTSFLGVYTVDEDSNVLAKLRHLEIHPQVTLELEGVDELIHFQRLGNRRAGNSDHVFFKLTVGDQESRVESCFNGRVRIRDKSNLEASKC